MLKKKDVTKWTHVFIQKSTNPEIFFSVRLVWHNSEKLQVSVVGDLWPGVKHITILVAVWLSGLWW